LPPRSYLARSGVGARTSLLCPAIRLKHHRAITSVSIKALDTLLLGAQDVRSNRDVKICKHHQTLPYPPTS